MHYFTPPTPSNAGKKEDVAKTVLMPGDPLRAKFIAENYLTEVICYNTVRGMFGYTGYYKGKRVAVQASGMGIPSMGIYSYELFNFYDVDNIIRIGTAGAMKEDIRLKDIIFAMGASTDSNFASQFELTGVFAPICSFELLEEGVRIAKARGASYRVGNVITTDVFYNPSESYTEKWAGMGILAVEMETAGLYMNAAYAGKNALSILTVSDQLIKKENATLEERETGFIEMMEIALEIAK